MENTEAAVRGYLTGLVSEALAGNPPQMSLRFAQLRFVKGDPATVSCTWPAGGREFVVAFSGEAVTNFVTADEARLGRLHAAAVAAIKAQYQSFEGEPGQRHPFQCKIDYLGV